MTDMFIIGSGSFGTALAQAWSEKQKVTIYGIEKEIIKEINFKHTNKKYLEGVKLNKNLTATSDISQVSKAKIIILAVPSYAIKFVCKDIKPYIKNQTIISTAKGIDVNGQIMTTVIEQNLNVKPGKVYALSGPSIAKEVGEGKYFSLVLGGLKNTNGKKVAKKLQTKKMQIILSSDKDGIQLLGFYKNVIAIITGMCEELDMGDNFKTAMISKAYSQFYKQNKDKISSHTFLGPAGIGDLFVTATSIKSRNHKFGRMLIKYKSIEEIKEKIGHIVEGYESMRRLKKDTNSNFDKKLISLMKKANKIKDKTKIKNMLVKYLRSY